MTKVIKSIIIVSILMALANGCVSYSVYETSRKRVVTRKAIASGDQNAIKAVRLGNDGVGIGIDVTNMEALGERPWVQLGAAFIDAALIYGGYKTVRYLDPSDTKDNSTEPVININGDRNNTTVITGDNNTTSLSSNHDSRNGE